MSITTLITNAILRGAEVHTTSHDDGELATVQVLGLHGMTTWPLPAHQAGAELAEVLR